MTSFEDLMAGLNDQAPNQLVPLVNEMVREVSGLMGIDEEAARLLMAQGAKNLEEIMVSYSRMIHPGDNPTVESLTIGLVTTAFLVGSVRSIYNLGDNDVKAICDLGEKVVGQAFYAPSTS